MAENKNSASPNMNLVPDALEPYLEQGLNAILSASGFGALPKGFIQDAEKAASQTLPGIMQAIEKAQSPDMDSPEMQIKQQEAIVKIQKHAGLVESGILDDPTKEAIKVIVQKANVQVDENSTSPMYVAGALLTSDGKIRAMPAIPVEASLSDLVSPSDSPKLLPATNKTVAV
jgi:hypothetical protein